MADIFVSYASEDRDRVRPLVDVLEAEGWSVWWERTLHAGPRFDLEIEKALDAARCVVVAWSRESIRSDWVHGEANEGLRRGILVPAAFDSVMPPLQFRRNQTAQLLEWPGELPMLIAGVRAVLSMDVADDARTANDRIVSVRSGMAARTAWRSGMAAALAIAVVAVVGYLYLPRDAARTPTPQAMQTAVFPFATPKADEAAASLANAIANEMVDTMNTVGLSVIARGALESLGREDRAARAIELGAMYALDGDIRHEPGQFLVSVRIESLKFGTTLWAHTYRDTEAAATVLPTRVAIQAVDTLRCASPEPGWAGSSDIAPDDVDSQRLLMHVCAQFRGYEPAEHTREVLRTLAARYPKSAKTVGSLATYLASSLSAMPSALRVPMLEEAELAAQRAMALGPDLASSYLALIWVRTARGASGFEIGSLLEEGLRRDPEDARANHFYGKFLQDTGRYVDAETYLRRGAAHDPLSSAKQVDLAENSAALGRTAEAAQILRNAAARWQEQWFWHLRMHHAVFDGTGELDALMAGPPDEPSIDHDLACWRELAAAMTTANPDQRRREGVAAVERCSGGIEMRVAFGDIDGAFAEADDIPAWGDPDRPFLWGELTAGPLLTLQAKPLQRDPRFMPLMQRLGVLAIWQESDYWPDFCRSPGLPYDCRVEGERLARGT